MLLIDSNDSMAVEITEKEFRIYMIKMVCEAKDKIREQMQAMRDHSSRQEQM